MTSTARLLRAGFYGAGTWGAVTLFLLLTGVVHERVLGPWPMVLPLITTVGLGAVCNVMGIPMIPDAASKRLKPGLRNFLWRGRLGEWLGRRLRAPSRSQLAGASAFRATEAALGVAALELFAALPKAYRDQLADLPATIEALEAGAAEARAEMDVLAALAPSGSNDADTLAARRKKAKSHLGESVAALESIRLDLLRLHANASDLAPLTTLMDAARLLGDDLNRLAAAQREADDVRRSRASSS